MSATDEPLIIEEPITEVPRGGLKKRYVLFALLVVVAVVLGLRRARSKPVANEAAPGENEA